MNWYFKLVANHPYIIVCSIGAFSFFALIISALKGIPNFSDPLLGFETRGTEIANRLAAWDNLNEASRPSGILAVNPLADVTYSLFDSVKYNTTKTKKKKKKIFMKKKLIVNSNYTDKELKKPWGVKKKPLSKFKANFSEINNKFYIKPKNGFKNKNKHEHTHKYNQGHKHNHLSSDGFFCEKLSSEYSHVVIESYNSSESLLTLDSMLSVCIIQQKLMNHKIMSSLCQTIAKDHCCNPWSLPNYISLLFNHSNCLNITSDNIRELKDLLHQCAKYYNNLQLTADCKENNLCHNVPKNCTKYNAVYNILYYLTDINFFSYNYSALSQKDIFLNKLMIFLPIARSSAALPYYYNLSKNSLKYGNVHISAMDLGLKNALFNDCLVRDASLMTASVIFIILCIWCYTNSFFLTFSTILAITMSLVISYFMYSFLFRIKFFPFMNLLAIIVAIGIGADDAFIFYKMWQIFTKTKTKSLVKLVSDTLKHSVASMLVTSLTTAAAFYSSLISSITAINCFGIFAGTAVLTNFFLMMTWLPACFVISQKIYRPTILLQWRLVINSKISDLKEKIHQVKALLNKYLIMTIIRLKFFWLTVFAILAMGCVVVVMYYPKLKLPDSKNFQLFQSHHFFELYDSRYKNSFWFERFEKINSYDDSNFKLPLRFVWGVLPIDNGNYLEPNSKGTLEFDLTFDIADPESQNWLLNFCRLLRNQPFYQSTRGPLLPNCFIEAFKSWMERRCVDVSDNIERSPCCESSKFPFSREVFKKCIIKAIGRLHETPSDYFLPGVAGPKFSKNKKEEIKVIVIEYDSNYSYSMSFNEMHNFYIQVENWFQNQLADAPPGMRNGWFISDLSFYDLQLALSSETSVSIGVSMIVSLAMFFLVSLNILISIYTIITISCIIFVTIAFLVIIGWSLNILESIAVTSTIGLAMDFTLHYGINFGLFVENSRESAVGFTLSKMGGPTLMAALTTGAAGLFMLPSSVLAYIEIGLFLLIVMGCSWIYSTFFLMSILSIVGPEKGCGQFSYKSIFSLCSKKKKISSLTESNKTVFKSMLVDSILSTSSTANAFNVPHSEILEIHELEALRNNKNIEIYK